MTVLTQPGDQLRTDQSRPTDNNDLHDVSLRSPPTAVGQPPNEDKTPHGSVTGPRLSPRTTLAKGLTEKPHVDVTTERGGGVVHRGKGSLQLLRGGETNGVAHDRAAHAPRTASAAA
jgi:hypothetical protein